MMNKRELTESIKVAYFEALKTEKEWYEKRLNHAKKVYLFCALDKEDCSSKKLDNALENLYEAACDAAKVEVELWVRATEEAEAEASRK